MLETLAQLIDVRHLPAGHICHTGFLVVLAGSVVLHAAAEESEKPSVYRTGMCYGMQSPRRGEQPPPRKSTSWFGCAHSSIVCGCSAVSSFLSRLRHGATAGTRSAAGSA